jgi:hypothetical protein
LSIDSALRLIVVAAVAAAPLVHTRIDQHGYLLLASIIPATP